MVITPHELKSKADKVKSRKLENIAKIADELEKIIDVILTEEIDYDPTWDRKECIGISLNSEPIVSKLEEFNFPTINDYHYDGEISNLYFQTEDNDDYLLEELAKRYNGWSLKYEPVYRGKSGYPNYRTIIFKPKKKL